MNATIKQNGDEVVLRYETWDGETVVKRFWVSLGGGNVYEITNQRHGVDGMRVCAGLAYLGNTLSVPSPDHLLPTIRREWRSVRRRLMMPWA